MVKKIETKNLMIQFMKYNQEVFIIVDDYINLINYIYKSLSEKKLLKDYEIAYDVDKYSLIRVSEYNSDIFIDDIKYSDKIYILNSEIINDLINKYSVDETIDEIIRNYCDCKRKKIINNNLYNSCKDKKLMQLTVDGGPFVDIVDSQYVVNNFVENGFVENFCLSDEEKEEVKKLRLKNN